MTVWRILPGQCLGCTAAVPALYGPGRWMGEGVQYRDCHELSARSRKQESSPFQSKAYMWEQEDRGERGGEGRVQDRVGAAWVMDAAKLQPDIA